MIIIIIIIFFIALSWCSRKVNIYF